MEPSQLVKTFLVPYAIHHVSTSPLLTPTPHSPLPLPDLSLIAFQILTHSAIDLYHTAAILSPRRTKTFVFARPASHWMRAEMSKIFCLSIAG